MRGSARIRNKPMKIKGEFTRFLKQPGEDGNGFALASYESGGSLQPTKIGGPFSSGMKSGQWFAAEGYWKSSFYKDKKEMVFQARLVLPALPDTPEGAVRFLSSSFNSERHGVTQETASAYVARYGASILDRAVSDFSVLAELTRDPRKFAEAIENDWKRIIEPLAPLICMEKAGVDESAAAVAYAVYRERLMSVIRTNPYDLSLISDFPFDEADKIGKAAGIAKNDKRRVVAALRSVVRNNGSDGHTSTPVKLAVDSLRTCDIENLSVQGLLELNDRVKGVVFSNTGGIAAHMPQYFDAETAIANKVAKLVSENEADPAADEVIERVLSQAKYAKFDEIQRNAVVTSSRNRIAILTGGPGTGKSTVTEAIAEIAAEISGGPVLLMAPTGKAARRLEETTGRRASTVHRALGASGDGSKAQFRHNASNPLPAGCFVIVDEASMLDVEVASALLDALPPDGRILFVGDRHQLPSVGPGYVLGDLIAAESPTGVKVPCSELLNVYRTDKKSRVAAYAAQVREGTFDARSLPQAMSGGVIMYDTEDRDITDKVVGLVRNAIPKSLKLNPKEVAVLSPQRQGSGGTNELNAALSRALNPSGREIPDMPSSEKGVPVPRVGDRVMLTVNDYENDVMNGDIGEIVDAFRQTTSGGTPKTMVKVRFDTGQEVVYPVWRCRDLVLAYAITGHKSQGSQYRCVIMPLSTEHDRMLDRTLVYTEMTRSKEYLIMVGSRAAMQAAVENTSSSQRMTSLSHLLGHALAHVARRAPTGAPGVRIPAVPGARITPPVPAKKAPPVRPPSFRPPARPANDDDLPSPRF